MNLLKSLVTVSFITFFSRILGFIRDSIIAQVFGIGIESDAFFIAFKIPNLFRRIFAEGAFSQAFIPILVEYKDQQDTITTRNFIASITGLIILVLILITITGILIAPWIITIIAPGFVNIPGKFILTTTLLHITFPYILLISLTSLASSILNAWNQFSIPASTPILLNISMISFILLVTPIFYQPIMALAWAVIVGGILQLTSQIPYLKKINMLVLPIIQFSNAGIWRVLRKMGSAILGVSISQISLIINTIFSSFLVSSSVSWMYYADRLIEFPSGILGVTLGTILLPSLSHSFTNGNYNEYSYLLDWGLRLCFILALPSTVALCILAHPLIVTLFQYGKFSTFDTLMTQQALIAQSLGLLGLILVKILTSGFYSCQDIKTPVRISILTLIITQLMNLIFVIPLRHVGLLLSISIAAYFNASILYWRLHQQKIFQPQPGWFNFLCRLILAVIIMSLVLVKLISIIPDWTQNVMLWRLIYLIGIIIISATIYLITLWLTGFRLHNFVAGISSTKY